MSVAVAVVIVIVLVTGLLLATLVAGRRRPAPARAEDHPETVDYDDQPFRSHAEASRRRDRGRP